MKDKIIKLISSNNEQSQDLGIYLAETNNVDLSDWFKELELLHNFFFPLHSLGPPLTFTLKEMVNFSKGVSWVTIDLSPKEFQMLNLAKKHFPNLQNIGVSKDIIKVLPEKYKELGLKIIRYTKI